MHRIHRRALLTFGGGLAASGALAWAGHKAVHIGESVRESAAAGLDEALTIPPITSSTAAWPDATTTGVPRGTILETSGPVTIEESGTGAEWPGHHRQR